MSHEHEMSTYQRNGDRVDLPALLKVGRKHQEKTGWIPPTVLEKRKKDAEAAAQPQQELAAVVTEAVAAESSDESP